MKVMGEGGGGGAGKEPSESKLVCHFDISGSIIALANVLRYALIGIPDKDFAQLLPQRQSQM